MLICLFVFILFCFLFGYLLLSFSFSHSYLLCGTCAIDVNFYLHVYTHVARVPSSALYTRTQHAWLVTTLHVIEHTCTHTHTHTHRDIAHIHDMISYVYTILSAVAGASHDYSNLVLARVMYMYIYYSVSGNSRVNVPIIERKLLCAFKGHSLH